MREFIALMLAMGIVVIGTIAQRLGYRPAPLTDKQARQFRSDFY